MKLFFICLMAGVLFLLPSCLTPKQKFDKLVIKNPHLVPTKVKIDTITSYKIVNVKGKDSIVKQDSLIYIECPDIDIPKKRYEARKDYKRERQREKTIRDSLNFELKKLRSELKKLISDNKSNVDIQESKENVEVKKIRYESLEILARYTSLILFLLLLIILILKFFKKR